MVEGEAAAGKWIEVPQKVIADSEEIARIRHERVRANWVAETQGSELGETVGSGQRRRRRGQPWSPAVVVSAILGLVVVAIALVGFQFMRREATGSRTGEPEAAPVPTGSVLPGRSDADFAAGVADVAAIADGGRGDWSENLSVTEGSLALPMPSPESALRNYLERGLSGRDELNTLLLEGRLEFAGESFDFRILKRRPQSFRFEFAANANVVRSLGAVAPEDGVWQAITVNGEVREVGPAPADLAEKVRLISYFDFFRLDRLALQWRSRPDSVKVELDAPAAVDGVVCQVLVLTRDGGESVRAFVNPATGNILRESYLHEGQEISAFYRGFLARGEYRFPSEIIHQRDGETFDRMFLTRVAANPGLFTEVFEAPVVR